MDRKQLIGALQRARDALDGKADANAARTSIIHALNELRQEQARADAKQAARTIKIAWLDGAREVETKAVVGSVAVHRVPDGKGWQLTHIPTGFMLPCGPSNYHMPRTLGDAMKMAEFFNGALPADGEFREVPDMEPNARRRIVADMEAFIYANGISVIGY